MITDIPIVSQSMPDGAFGNIASENKPPVMELAGVHFPFNNSRYSAPQGVLNDTEIKFLCDGANTVSKNPMISPFSDKQNREILDIDGTPKKCISWGLSSFGYDVRLDTNYKVFSNIHGGIIDPLEFDGSCLHESNGPSVVIPPNSYLLGSTVEYFDMPADVMAIVMGKSTIARVGAIVNCTPIEPGFKGNVVIEISNSTTLPIRIHAGMGIAQFIFFRGNRPSVTYADRAGKYQNQTGITLAKV